MEQEIKTGNLNDPLEMEKLIEKMGGNESDTQKTLKNIENLLFSIKEEAKATGKNIRFFFYLTVITLTLSVMYFAYMIGS